jgi:benzoyl-CoA reductase/2-hydroxyglutaryl-CoA dehydratase subunit BcrC/BadD/HgdB
MQDKIQTLIEANSESNRAKYAMEWKKQGKKVIGVLSPYVPEEAIAAAGMLPYRITGTWKEGISHARVYRPESSNGYCNHVLESILNGELDFLDGIILADLDHEMLRLWDVLAYIKKPSFIHIVHIPFMDTENAIVYVETEVRKLIKKLEAIGGKKITDEALQDSVDTFNKMRTLLGDIYALRKKNQPPLTGAEYLGLATAAQIMPRDIFNKELESALPSLANRKPDLKYFKPRILVASDYLDDPAYLKLIEEKCLVAMDDIDNGSRYFMQIVDTVLDNPAHAIAKRYLSHHGGPSMIDWDRQIDQIKRWVAEYKIDGVVTLTLKWDYPQQYRAPILKQELEKAGIPNTNFEREYHLTNVGQLRTRIGAFLEILSDKVGAAGGK